MKPSSSPSGDSPCPQELLQKAADATRVLLDPSHPEYAATRARLAEIEAEIRAATQPMLDALAASERITAADLAIVINAGLKD